MTNNPNRRPNARETGYSKPVHVIMGRACFDCILGFEGSPHTPKTVWKAIRKIKNAGAGAFNYRPETVTTGEFICIVCQYIIHGESVKATIEIDAKIIGKVYKRA